jgi:hypothetical protein
MDRFFARAISKKVEEKDKVFAFRRRKTLFSKKNLSRSSNPAPPVRLRLQPKPLYFYRLLSVLRRLIFTS